MQPHAGAGDLEGTETGGAGLDRRAALLRAALGLGAVGLAASFLTGCGGRSSRAGRLAGGGVSGLGQPIPPDPVLHRRSGVVRAGSSSSRSPVPPRSGGVVASGGQQAGVIGRSSWARGGPVMSLANPMGPVRRITIHHDGIGSAPSGDWGDSARRLETIRRGHLSRGWADIGYHYAVDPSGRVWACRPTSLQGAHVSDNNENNVGIVVLGDFERSQPSDQARRALSEFVGSQMRQHRVHPRNVYTHRELASTVCPGTNLQRFLVWSRTPTGSIGSVLV